MRGLPHAAAKAIEAAAPEATETATTASTPTGGYAAVSWPNGFRRGSRCPT